MPGLDELHRRAVANGVPGMVRLTQQIADIEPAVRGVAALHSPVTAITDYGAIARAYASDISRAGGNVPCGFAVVRIEQDAGSVVLHSADGRRVVAGRVLVCAGLHGDQIAVMAGDSPDPRIIPFRGNYELAAVKPQRSGAWSTRFPTRRSHFLACISRGWSTDACWLAQTPCSLARGRDTGCRPFGWATSPAPLWPGFRRLARRYWRVGLTEMRRSVSKRQFAREAAAFMPGYSAA